MAHPCPHLFAPGQVAMKHPSAVTACNLDLENLVTDSNRSIATLAITTLLKTGSEGSIDRLMKQISSFMSEISDEFKVRSLCLEWGGPGGRQGTLLVEMCEALHPAFVSKAGSFQASRLSPLVSPWALYPVLGRVRREGSSTHAALPSELASWGGKMEADTGVDGVTPHAGAARKPSGWQFPGELPWKDLGRASRSACALASGSE